MLANQSFLALHVNQMDTRGASVSIYLSAAFSLELEAAVQDYVRVVSTAGGRKWNVVVLDVCVVLSIDRTS